MKLTQWVRVAAVIATATASAVAFDLSLLDDDTNYRKGRLHAPQEIEEERAASAGGSLTQTSVDAATSTSASTSTSFSSSGPDGTLAGSALSFTSNSAATSSDSGSDAGLSSSSLAAALSNSGSDTSLPNSGSDASLSMSGSEDSASADTSTSSSTDTLSASESDAASTSGSGDSPVASSTGSSATQNTGGGDFLAPFSTEEPSTTLFPRSALGEMAPIINVAEGLLGKPLPTNKWWGNIIHTTAEEMNTKANPGWSNPYAVKLPKKAPYGIQACYSYNYRQLSALTDGVAEFYLHDFVNDLTLSATEFAGEAKPTYEIYAFSDFGINVRACLENKVQCLDSALVHGMAFITATYDRLTARIESEYTMEIVDKSVPGKYILQLGGNQTWVVYTGNNGSFALAESGKALVSSGLFSGTVRVAILPSKKATTVYDKYRACHVRGGNVSVESRTQYSLNWETVGKSCKTNGMLHFALPHHLPALKGAITAKSPKAIVLNSATRGKMVAQVATTGKWVLSEPEDELEVDFYPTSKPSAEVVAKVGLLQTLQADIADHWALNKTSWYFNGKQYQKYASVCLMAADSAIVGKDKKLLSACLTKLEKLLVPFLDNTLDPPLHYETSYGGLVSSQSFTVKDVNADFGNSVYNDHHYHYGYWVTASAMLKSLHPKWERIKELDRMIWMMLRDVANPSTDDPFFPQFRHFSFYLGHSYSHGVTPMLDGKDEESTSEDVNFYYGMKLWGQVSSNKAVEDLGSLMLRLNARAIRTYFLMTSDNTIHPTEFVPNHVTGIFFDNKAAYATWFSGEKYAIHGIQMIPVSPINAMVRTTKFIQQEWDDILSKQPIVTESNTFNAWLSLLLVNQAAVDQEDALTKLQEATMDDGLTRSWALYNAASRPHNAKQVDVA
ncbi:Glycosyl hydrolase family 81 C-terminal domain [Phytophthora infestans]|uniref:glucan endo-1,3-beta-D-glucosidase n=1 Tax=Phytophthora infestans TaxID=4787 RepID=A0A8S9TH73_PHYIN|nr:Glycosyl hydrolase family 81 C-terminal domain [Phytophthora infestans]